LHICARCGKEAKKLEDISNGCSCGSKIFIYKQEGQNHQSNEEIISSKIDSKNEIEMKRNGKLPESYFAYSTFTTEDIENIKILSDGVFLLDLKGLSKDPIVLKDSEGIYYIKLPFEKPNGKKEII
jgi:predicted  nucleic acid-binding Zn-ribbon protein